MDWISVDKELPPMFENVIVCGIIEQLNVCSQIWEARRFTGCTMGFGDNPPWEWIGRTDYPVKDVHYWMPIPEFPTESSEHKWYSRGREKINVEC